MDGGVGEEVCGWGAEGYAEEAVVGAVGGYEGGPEVELVGASCEVGLESVEGGKGCVAWEDEGGAGWWLRDGSRRWRRVDCR